VDHGENCIKLIMHGKISIQ